MRGIPVNNLLSLLTPLRNRLSAIAHTEWKDAGDWFHDCRVGVSLTEGEECDDEAATLIAHAPHDLATLLALVEVMSGALTESCMCGSHPEGEKNWCAACESLIECEKIAGGKL